MGFGIYPVFESKLRNTRFEALGEVLVANIEALDDIATAAELTSLTAFADMRDVPEDFDGSPEELEDMLGPWTEWFDPAEGRAVIQALIAHIGASMPAAELLDGPAEVIEELAELARVLGVAAAEGIRFRLEMG